VLSKGGFFLSELSPSRDQKRAALAIAALLGIAFCVLLLFYARKPAPPIPGFVPVLDTTLFLTDLATAVLLYSQFTAARAPAVLALATGYLFTALVIAAHLLAFPGIFSVPGLLGSNLQAIDWLYVLWHLGLPPGVIVYAALKGGSHPPVADARFAVFLSAAGVALLVSVLVLMVASFGQLLPVSGVEAARANLRWGHFAGALILLLSAAAYVLLWGRRTAVLDVWLLVVLWAWLIEALMLILAPERFSVMWYAGYSFALLASSVVLLALLYELTRIYARLATAEEAREREHESKRLSLEVIVGSIAHELRQPLTAIVANCDAGLELLARLPPDMEETRVALTEIEAEGLRASEILTSIQTGLTEAGAAAALVDVSQVVSETVGLLRAELRFHEVVVRLETAAELPRVKGNKGQLLQVMVNLITNAVFAMRDITSRARVLSIRTQLHDPGTVAIQVEDSGIGISPELHTRIFEPLFTTKARGNGLGLTICRSIIEAHQGRIAVLRAGAQGACLQVLLPADRS
jgi:signal transduction histidine kinase